ncbi:MAG: ParA family protein [Candidatus Krumholzibacteriia bacterium]
MVDNGRPHPERPGGIATVARHTTPWNSLSARVISLISRKGGVGKTTSAVNLGAALALSGHTVLVVGLDPQCGVCRSLGRGPEELDGRLLDMFRDGRPLVHLAQTSPLKNLFFASPGILSLEDEDAFLALLEDRVDAFVTEMDRARNLYDTILLDCPPGLGAPARAALLASDGFLVPVQAEELCRDSVAPLLAFVDSFRNADLEEARARTGGAPAARPLELEGLFLTMATERTRMGRHVSARLHSDHAATLLSTAVPRTTRLAEMALRGKPAVIYDRRSPGSRAYFDLADELVSRHCARTGVELPQPGYAESEGEPVEDWIGPATAEAAAGEMPRRIAPQGARPPDAAISGHGGGTGSWHGSFDRFLADLRGPDDGEDAALEAQGPEIVSLDDLLAEEERGAAAGGWEDDPYDDSWLGEEPQSGRSH